MRYFSVLTFFATMSVHAGVVLQVSERELPSGSPAPSEIYYAQDGMMRIDELNAAGAVTRTNVVRDGVIWEINPQERTFTRIDAATMKSFFGGQNAQMQAMLAKLPPEQQAAMQARVAQMQQRTIAFSYTDAGHADQAGQYSCRVWTEQLSNRPYAEYCVVSSSSLPGGAELSVSMKKALDTVAALTAGVPQMEKSAEHFSRMEKMNGFPVRQRFLSSTGQASREKLLTSADTQSLSGDKFAVPQGFTEKPLGAHASN
jgi:hypothetical protein